MIVDAGSLNKVFKMTMLKSGYKLVDSLANSNGISNSPTENEFQLSVKILASSDAKALTKAISPFGLAGFPNTMWLALQRLNNINQEVILHRFTLPAAKKVICWALVDIRGNLIEKAFPMNKPIYVKAASAIIACLASADHRCNNGFKLAG